MTKTALAVVSGGLDSTTMVYDLLNQDYEVQCISFNYGQRHRKELVFASANARMLNLDHDIVDITSITKFISNSALTSDGSWRPTETASTPVIEVPEGHYAEENMKATVVPNRNMIMLSIAAGIAVNRGLGTIATAVHAGDHFIYPDCRPEFIAEVAEAIAAGNEGFAKFEKTENGGVLPLTTPYLYKTKAEIAFRALNLNVPLHLTWSCYVGGSNHCGRCGTCVERLEAIDEALRRYNSLVATSVGQKMDATAYDDTEFWKVAIEKAKSDA